MKVVSLPNWDAFATELQKLRDGLPKDASGKLPELLFRGQSDSAWPLTTTLERAGYKDMSFEDYYRMTVQRVKPTVETFTEETWDVPEL